MPMKIYQGMNGARKSGTKGQSVEFSDFREYLPGDDIRHIDWNAYGRSDRLYIKQFMEEKEGIYNIYIDSSKSMDFGEMSKWDKALEIAGALAYIALSNMDRVYINGIKEDSLKRGKGLVGKAAFPKVVEQLSRLECDGKTSIKKAVLSRPVAAGGVSIIISDFFDREGVKELVAYLRYRKQKVVLIQLLAREELEVDLEGTVNLLDLEEGDRVKITMSNASVKAYKNALKEHQHKLQGLAKKYGAVYVKLTTEQSLEECILNNFSKILQPNS